MAHRVTPHYEHHVREMQRTRRRFRLALGGLVVALSVLVGMQYHSSSAATLYTVSGRVYDAGTGVGLANVKLQLCTSGAFVVTNGNGGWSIAVPYQYQTCVRYVSGVPAGATGPVAVNNQPDHDGAATYESQVA